MSAMLEDKSMIITGGGSGIGRATAYACAEQGAKLLIADLNLDAASYVNGVSFPVDGGYTAQ